MEKKKRILLILISSTACFFAVLFFILHFPQIMNALSSNKGNVATPRITYWEFPIRIEYVVDGDTMLVEDVLICEYDGIQKKTWLEKINTGRSFDRLWKCKTKNNNDKILLYSNNEITIDFSFGSPDYYMGDEDVNTTYPSFRVFKKTSNGEELNSFVFSLEELSNYGIKIVDCVLPSPIDNTFE